MRTFEFECLEQRQLLSTVSWDGGGDGVLWSDAENWSEDRLPSEQDDVVIDLPGETTIIYRGVQPDIRSLTNAETVWIQGSSTGSHSTLNIRSGLTNSGVLRLESLNSGFRSNVAVGGVLANFGIISVNAGSGGERAITGNLTNTGTIDVALNATLLVNGNDHVVQQGGGSINAVGRFMVEGGTFHYTGGSLSGNVGGHDAKFDVAETVTSASTVYAWGGESILLGNLAPNVTLWVQGRSTESHAVLALSTDAVNAGTIRLESRDGGFSANLATGPNTLRNSGTIVSYRGSSGLRTITGNVVNSGLIEVPANSYLTVTGGVFEAAGGRIAGSAVLIDTQIRVTASPAQPTTLVLAGLGNVLVSDVLPNTTLWVNGRDGQGAARLTIPGPVTNRGTILLESSDRTFESSVVVQSGALTNAGIIDVNAGSGGVYTVGGNLTNTGLINVELNTTLAINGTNPLLTHAGGSIQADGRLTLQGGTFRFTGGTVVGSVGGDDTRFDVAETVTSASTVYAWGAGSTLIGNRSRHVTLWVQGRDSDGHSLLTAGAGAVNAGTIRLESRDRALSSELATGLNSIFNTGRIVSNLGTGGFRTITGNVVNSGLIEVPANSYLTVTGGVFEAAGGRIDGSAVLIDTQIRVTASPAQPTTLVLAGLGNVLVSDVLPNTTLWVNGRDGQGAARLTIPGPVTNRGTILLESSDRTFESSVVVQSGALTNAGILDVNVGSGGVYTVTGNLTNTGLIDVEVGSTLTINGSEPVFHQSGGSIEAAGRLVLVGGIFQVTGGAVRGTVGGRGSRFDISETATLASTVYAWGNLSVLLGNRGPNVTLWVQGKEGESNALLTTASGAVNAGRLHLESRDRNFSSNLTTATGGLTNTGVIEAGVGSGGTRTILGEVSNEGIIRAGEASTLVFMSSLTVKGSGILSTLGSGRIQLQGSLLGDTREADRFALGASLVVSGSGTKFFEVMGRNLGNTAQAFGGNFAIGSLALAGGATVRLVDQQRNSGAEGAEAAYVDSLDVAPGTTLDLNGLTLYTRAASIRGTVLGGAVIEGVDGGQFSLGQSLPGRITAPGEVDEWSFYGRAGQHVTVQLTTGSGSPGPLPPQLNWAEVFLIGPTGTQLAGGVSLAEGAPVVIENVLLPGDGNYRIRIQAPPSLSNSTGRYILGAYETSAGKQPILLNQQYSGILPSSFRIDQWTFSATAGQQAQLDVINTSNATIKFSLRDPNGSVLFAGLTASSGLTTLPVSGIYTLSVDALQGQPGSYAFRLKETSLVDLELDEPFAGRFSGNAHAQLFRVDIDELTRLRIALDDESAANQNEIYVKLGSPPTRSDFQFRFDRPASPDQEVLVPAAVPGSWYVLVYAKHVPTPSHFTLLATASRVLLDRVTPNRLGNEADMTLTLAGAGFDGSAIVELVGSSHQAVYRARSVSFDQTTQLTATFAANTVPPGTYDVRVTQAGGLQTTLPGAFTAIPGARTELWTNLITPRTFGFRQPGEIVIEYANRGDVAMPAPLLMLTATQNGKPGALLTLDNSRLIEGLWTSAIPDGFTNSVQFLGSGETPGVLQPGESVRVIVHYAGWQKPWTASAPFLFTLSTLTSDDLTPIDWAAMESSLRPDVYSPAAWAPIFANLTSSVGATWGDYVRMLNENSAYLARLGQDVRDIGELLGFELIQANGLTSMSVLAQARDASVEAPGLDLTFNRAFGPTLADRNRIGALGRGWTWTDGWDQAYAVLADGTVVIRQADGRSRRFQPDSRRAGQFFAESGDSGLITELSSNGLVLREKSGLTLRFGADGSVRSMSDPNGNTITATLVGGRPTRLVHSGGASLDIAYNATGRIISVTDSRGRATRFTYDPTNQYLLSAEDFGGRITRYTYDQVGGPAQRHALLSIETPSGVRQYYKYDERGRIESASGTDGSALTTYAYDAVGTIFLTTPPSASAPGGTGSLWFDHHGRVARLSDPLGRSSFASYDRAGNLVQVSDSEGRTVRAGFDARGNLTSVVDTLGNETRFDYTGSFNRLGSFTDANGNLTRYAYDARGNLVSSTNADGSVERWTYDETGNVDTWTNRRGAQIGYEQDASGRVTAKTYADQSRVTYTYDALGNLASTTDPTGTTTYTHDLATGFLTKITYSDGRSLSFTYCTCGRRTSSTDETGYRIDYEYDALGRLQSLTDSNGTMLVRYHFDSAGNLAKKTLANGVETTYTYDAAGQILSLVNLAPGGTVLSRFDYTYDRRGLRTSMTTLDGRWVYTYDDAGQLAGYTSPDGRQVAYIYDALGNRLEETVIEGSDAFVIASVTNDLNQYVNASGDVYSFDLDGNLIRQVVDGVVTNYTFDAENRLVRVTRGSDEQTYTYDALGNRVASTFNGDMTRFVIDPIGLGNVVGEYDASGQLVARNVHGYGLISRDTPSAAPYYFTFDAQGNTSELIGAGGGVLNRYVFEPFGGSYQSTEMVANPFQFVGEFGVMRESQGLDFMRARFYDSSIAKFLSPDPIGLRSGDVNFYRYTENSPTNAIDPSGLDRTINDLIGGDDEDGGDEGWAGTGMPFSNPYGPGDFEGIHPDFALPDDTYPDLSGDEGLPETGLPDGSPFHPDDNGDVAPGDGWGLFPPTKDTNQNQVNSGEPSDPNEKLGPAGHGPEGFVAPGDTFLYRVNFENLETATAPAQRVDITDPLSADLDWSSFELIQVGFGDTRINIPAGLQDFETIIAATYNGRTFDVEIRIGLDPATGLITVAFQSVDPTTSLPPDVLTGFLPPEDGTGRGQGFFTYTIRPRANLPTGTEIRNIAQITFNRGMTIATDQVDPLDASKGIDLAKQSLNTIDAGAPTSRVAPLAPTTIGSSPSVTVSWAGEDDPGGSGVARYDLFVSVDGGPFTSWLIGTTQTSAVYAGEFGRRYAFQAMAIDHVGHRQAAPEAAQATTLVAAATTTTVQATSASIVYGQSLAFTAIVTSPSESGSLGGTVQFVVNGANFGPAVALVNGVAVFSSFNTLGAGTHTVSAIYSGSAGIPASAAAPIAVTVAKARLTVKARDAARVYGQANPAFSATYTGFVLGESPSVLGGSLGFATSATPLSYVGTYAITPGGLRSANYIITFLGGNLSVTPASLVITADDQSMSAGQSLPLLTATYSGFVNGDSPASLTAPVSLFAAAPSTGVSGSYAIVASGASSPNYAITYRPGTLTVLASPVAVRGVQIQTIKVRRRQLKVLVVSFDGGLNAGMAQSVGNYRLATAGKDKKFGTR
ncbi:MBG domain-containing protein [Singulisphaera sp. Ch08]|uniref:MBG domain-containing protein n=1 Tax=Singulisphaera sp. Ch08 TaxID=3120278 RepID=A0AAU7CJT7_9BACT